MVHILPYVPHRNRKKERTKNPPTNVTCLQFVRTIDFSHSIQINGTTYNSSTPAILANPANPEQYIVNIRFVNYRVNANGLMIFERPIMGTNSRFLVDASFTQITPETFLEEIRGDTNGLEDIRLFYYNNSIYYSACFYQHNAYNLMSCGKYEFHASTYTIEKHRIGTSNTKRHEKNWAYVEYKGEVCMVYIWYPLKIGKIWYPLKIESGEYILNYLHIVEEKQLPEVFKNIRGSTPSYRWKDEIWFLVHTTDIDTRQCRNYHHMFVVFDTDMNLLRYSETFKFENYPVEFCLGLILEEERTIVSYSTMECTTRIGLLCNRYIRQGLVWHTH